jgi:hypothetical protein
MTTTGTGSAVSGESYKFEKTSTKFHLGDTLTTIKASLGDDELPTLLADGKYIDSDNDEFDYTQSIDVAALQLSMFEDSDYEEDAPTIGFRVASGARVLNYTLDFSDEPLVADVETTDLPMMGRSYYVLDEAATSNGLKLTLLDSAEDTILAEGESTQLNVEGTTYDVAIEFVSSGEVKLDVNGEITNSLAEGQTYKLDDGSYVGIKDILYTAKDTGISKVEFSIGNGKLVLEDGQEVELNEDAISGLTVDITNTTAIQSIKLLWNTDDDMFITEDSELLMPGFEAIKLSYGGLTYPTEETIEVSNGGDDYVILNDFPLKDSTEDIAILYGTAGAFSGIGKDSDNLLVTSSGDSLTFDGDTDDYFVASWTDGNDAESYLMRATNFKVDNSINKTTIQYRKDGNWVDAKSDAQASDTFSVGNAELAVGAINKTAKTVVISNNSAEMSFNTLYSTEGLKVFLPYETVPSTAPGAINFTNTTVGHNATSFYLTMVEENKDEDKDSGDMINLTLGWNAATTQQVTVSAISTTSADADSTEIGSTDVYRDFTYSALATEILWDKSGDQDTVKLMYHGEEVSADVYITSPDATVTTGTGSLGEVLVMDSEVSSVDSKNLIIVGGSCINSAAATVLGGAYCGSAFTDATNVGPGQYLIKGVDGAYTAGKLALVVAGYNAEDTVAATTYLTTQTVDTSKSYIGTSSTSAEVVTESQ